MAFERLLQIEVLEDNLSLEKDKVFALQESIARCSDNETHKEISLPNSLGILKNLYKGSLSFSVFIP